jgi:hypothetical protein
MSRLASLIGLEVEQVWVWWSLRLVFELGAPGEPGTYVDVTEFQFTDPEGTTHELNVEKDPVNAGRVLSVLHRRVMGASADGWELRLAFDNGVTLRCPPRPKYEAWAASIPGESPIYCPPGGGADAPS